MSKRRAADEPGKLSAIALRLMCPMVVFDLIKPGDVLLTRGKGVEPYVISGASGGPRSSELIYSHSAIWLPFLTEATEDRLSRSLLMLAESDDWGVGDTPLLHNYIYRDDGISTDCIQLSPGTRDARLLRHPDLENRSVAELCAAADQLRKSDFYRSYSKLVRLVEATRFHPALKSIVRRGLAFMDGGEDDPVTGAFCSELVAKYFDILGVPIFKSDRRPHTISPNDLIHSLLGDAFPNAIITADSISDITFGYKSVTNSTRAEYLPGMVVRASISIRGASLLSKINSMMDGALEQGIKSAESQYNMTLSHMRVAEKWGDKRAAKRLAQLATLSLLVIRIYEERLKRRATADSIIEYDQSRSKAERQLQQICFDLSRMAEQDSLRTFILMGIREARLRWEVGGKTPKLTRLLTKMRLDLIGMWSKNLRLDRESQKSLNSITQPPVIEETTESKAYFEAVLSAAIKNTVGEGAAKATKNIAAFGQLKFRVFTHF